MNALLLTTLANPAPSGTGAALDRNQLTSSASLFADVLGQQSDLLDPKLVDLLQSLNLDSATQKELLSQINALGLDSEELQSLLPQLSAWFANQDNVTTFGEKIAVLLKQNNSIESETNSTIDLNQAASFVDTTLFIARESSAIRSQHAAAPAFAASMPTTVTALGADLPANSQKQNPAIAHLAAISKAPLAQNSVAPATNNRFLKQESTANNVMQSLAHQSTANQTSPNLSQALKAENNEANPAFLAALDKTSPAPTAAHSLGALSEMASGLQPLSTTATTHSPLAFTPSYQATIATPLQNTQQWGGDFSRIFVQMTQQPNQNGALQSAEIRLDPPELGPLRIVLSVNDSIANAMIFAAHAQTRLTVEQALPQLQQQLTQAGLSLGEASVSEQPFSPQTEQHSEQHGKKQSAFILNSTGQNDENNPLLVTDGQTHPLNPNAIIDTFA